MNSRQPYRINWEISTFRPFAYYNCEVVNDLLQVQEVLVVPEFFQIALVDVSVSW
jgi:hypothetical protein